MFLYTVKDKAKQWLLSLTPESLKTWDEVYNKFISRFYSSTKATDLRLKIVGFIQEEGEPFHEAWVGLSSY